MFELVSFSSFSPEAVISISFSAFSFIFSSYFSVLTPIGVKPSPSLLAFLVGITDRLYYFGKFSLWILAAIVIACIVPILEQIENFSQMCGNTIFNQSIPGCGKSLQIGDFIHDNHIHTFQIMVWFACGFLCWLFLVRQIDVAIEKAKVEKTSSENPKRTYRLAFKDESDCAGAIKNTLFVISVIFFLGAWTQQFLERYLA